MATIEKSILQSLEARFAALVFSPVLPVAWPNKVFTPSADKHYLRFVFVPNVTNRLMIGSSGAHQYLGLLQVSVYWSKLDGEDAPRDIAGLVAAHFPCDLKLNSGGVTVRITKRPDVRDLMVEDAAVQIPVMIAWEAFA
ncbi:MAG: DUF4128 domain-containing protein [Devosia sp.]